MWLRVNITILPPQRSFCGYIGMKVHEQQLIQHEAMSLLCHFTVNLWLRFSDLNEQCYWCSFSRKGMGDTSLFCFLGLILFLLHRGLKGNINSYKWQVATWFDSRFLSEFPFCKFYVWWFSFCILYKMPMIQYACAIWMDIYANIIQWLFSWKLLVLL